MAVQQQAGGGGGSGGGRSGGRSGGSRHGGGGNPFPNGTLAHVLYEAGFRGAGLRTAWAVAMKESGGNASAFNGNANTGDKSYGLFQINMIGNLGPQRLNEFGLSSDQQLLDPLTNARAAYQMSRGGKDFGAWGIGANAYDTGDAAHHAQQEAAVSHYLGQFDSQYASQKVGNFGQGTGTGGGGGMGPDNVNNPNHIDKLNPQELALHYGWAYSFLRSVPQLSHLFDQAIAGNWSTQKFTAELRGTQWFQSHSSTMRQNLLMQESDPASFKAHVADVQSSMRDAAAQMGVALPNDVLDRLATHAFLTGMTSAEMQNVLAAHLHEVNGQFSGSAGDTQTSLQTWADQNGIRIGQNWMTSAVRNVAAGNKAVNFYTEQLTNMAKSAFPGLAQHLDANTTVQQIADPYVQSMSNLLERSPSDINLFNPTIRHALSYTDPSTGKIGLQSLYDFENTVRQDPAWLNTQNAHDSFAAATHQLLQQWGVQF